MIVESVNVGRAVDVPWGSLRRSAIDKRPTPDRVEVHPLGLDGDEIADLVHHGGPDQAVYAFAAEQLDFWSVEIGRTIGPGGFGENLTTRGIDLNASRIGDRWRIGSTILEIAGVRIPCSVFQGFVDQQRWVKRFTAHGQPGPYFRVIQAGVVASGDPIEVIEERTHGLTVGHTFRALTTEQHLLPGLAAEPRCSARIFMRLEGTAANLPLH